jgi:SAM-dependent methyltransferase
MSTGDLRPFDRVAHVYDETRGMPPPVVDAIGDAIAARLRETAPRPRLLEVGIGTGRIAVPLAERGVRVAGIDIAPGMLARLREKRGDIDLAFAEAAWLPFRAGSFDGALFVHILHLVPDAAATVRATLATVRPGGWMLMGGDDRSPGHRDEADSIITAAIRDVCGKVDERRGVDGGASVFQGVCAEAGLAVESRIVAEWTSSTSGREMLDRLAARTFSQSWQIPDDQLADVVRVAEPGLRAHYGDLDRRVEFSRTFTLRTARV